MKATFFITGKNVEMYPEIVRKIHQEGASVIIMTEVIIHTGRKLVSMAEHA